MVPAHRPPPEEIGSMKLMLDWMGDVKSTIEKGVEQNQQIIDKVNVLDTRLQVAEERAEHVREAASIRSAAQDQRMDRQDEHMRYIDSRNEAAKLRIEKLENDKRTVIGMWTGITGAVGVLGFFIEHFLTH